MSVIQAEPFSLDFNVASTALVIIDMQRDFVLPGGFGEKLGNDTSLLLKAVEPTRQVLDTARRKKMLVIHTREADDDTLSILREEGGGAVRGVLHCFTGTPELARAGLDLGFYVSLAGIVTFPKAAELRETARLIPIDRLLTETDSPFLAPVPFRGKRNEPAYVMHTAAALARVKGVSDDEIAAVTTENFHRLYAKAPRVIAGSEAA